MSNRVMPLNKKYVESIDFDTLITMYEHHASYRTYRFIEDSKRLFYLCTQNHSQLLGLIKKYEHEVGMKDTKVVHVDIGRIRSQNYLNKMLQYLHNYCVSLYTLEQQYSEFLLGSTRYKSTPHNKEIGDIFTKISDNPKYLLLFALRNFFTHMSIPDISISVVHHKDVPDSGEGLFCTQGRFQIRKSFFTKDFNNRFWGDDGYRSRLLHKDKALEILANYINDKYRGKLDLDIKPLIIQFHEELKNHIKNVNDLVIEKEAKGYSEVKLMISEIKRRQDKLRKGLVESI